MPNATLLNPVKLSQDLLTGVRLGENITAHLDQLKALTEAALFQGLKDPLSAKAFWLNSYNAFVQIALRDHPGIYMQKSLFFTKRWIPIAGCILSFDDIEHGILRRSQFKYGFGYVPKLWVSAFEKKFRLNERDPRIHFALNCGARSCPPIRFYEPERIEFQLELATQAYLEQESRYAAEKNTLYLSRLFLWFRGDFGSRKALRQFLEKYRVIPSSTKARIRYLNYDWELLEGNFGE